MMAFTALSLASGVFAGLIRYGSGADLTLLAKPPLALPAAVFLLAQAALYILLGTGTGLVWRAPSPCRETGICFFALFLAADFLWPILFFVEGLHFTAFLWLCLTLSLALGMVCFSYRAKPRAAYLQSPYLVWLLYLGYLNLWIVLYN